MNCVTEDAYRQQWRWDRVAWGSHCVDCYPGNCPMHVYIKDGKIRHEEAAGVFPIIEQGVPDMNPMGCQKGVAWREVLDGKERVLYPLKRVGKRGEGKWERISWDQALTEVADAILDGIEEIGPESIIHVGGASASTWGLFGRGRFATHVGSLQMDMNAEITDFAPGHYMTYGFFDPVSSIDDWFHAELIFIWFANPANTRIPHQHYITEARYKGAEVVTVAPDFSPSAVHADHYVPVEPGTDAAFALGMAHVVIEEGLYKKRFVQEQTDLPLLVRRDTRMYLRQSDLEDGGSEDQFYLFDAKKRKIVKAPRASLKLGRIDPVLDGTFRARLKDGSSVRLTTVFALARERLRDYTPEKASAICGVSASVIRELGRKVARKRTSIICSLSNAGKFYHGDLIERSELLLLALTGNWGRKGTGVRAWTGGFFDGSGLVQAKTEPNQDARQLVAMNNMMIQNLKDADPSLSDELATIEFNKQMATLGIGPMLFYPPVFFWYYHCGFDEIWAKEEWHDPSMKRPFAEYWKEAIDKNWWQGVDKPTKEQEPRVLIECGGNMLRRTRGGQNLFLKTLWPKLKMVVTIDPRMSTTAMYSDIVLPAAQQYEKIAFGIPSSHTMNLTFSDKILDPPGEAKDEWWIFRGITEKMEQQAKRRGLKEYVDAKGTSYQLEGLYDRMVAHGSLVDVEKIADEMVRDTTIAGALPEGTSLETLREKGYERWTGLGIAPRAISQATEVKPDETFTPLLDHVDKKKPYATLTRRAQFLIDHPWFLEAGEELPCHKDPPPMGGDYPLKLTSGHNRWSIHALNIANRMMLQTHRGVPQAMLSPKDAGARGIKDGKQVKVYNDLGESVMEAKVTEAVRPGQLIIYNGWEPYQFSNWSDPSNIEPGMVKWLHLAGGYGHLRYWLMEWQPCPVDRATRVEIEAWNGTAPPPGKRRGSNGTRT